MTPAALTPAQTATAFFLALAAIVAGAQAIGWVARRLLGQPQVVGEMIAGILIGPSLLGLIWPEAQAALFPPALKPLLAAGAQLGVGLYMFIVGLGFRREEMRASGRAAFGVSLAGIAAPFALAALLAPWLLAQGGLFGPRVGQGQAALFLGACIAITAFPMLARIIHERGLSGTRLGTLALAAGAIDDAAAWIVLAIVLATLGSGPVALGWVIVGAVAFAAFTLLAGPRLLAPMAARAERDGVGPHLLALMLLLFLLSAYAMDAIGIHAVFGGFLLGIAVPRGRLTEELRAKLEPLTVALLLPVFFTFSGLSTRLDLLVAPALLLTALVVFAVAVLAKFGACWAAARLAGEHQATALGLGALMNARGLMELIIINIGLAAGIISPTLFSMLAAMAVLTTLAAGPLFALAQRAGRTTPARESVPVQIDQVGA